MSHWSAINTINTRSSLGFLSHSLMLSCVREILHLWLCRTVSFRHSSSSPTVLPRQGAGPALLSIAAGEGQSKLSYYHDRGVNSVPALGGKEARGSISPCLYNCSADKLQGWLSHTQTLMASDPCLQHQRSALLCCPVKVQSLFSLVLQSGRGRASSPALRTSGPSLLPT